MGFNLPLWQQFFIYLRQALTGDFGVSVLTTNPVMDDIIRVFPATLELATVGTLIGAGLGVPLGVIAAVRRGSIADQIVRIVGLIGYSVPIFWLGLLSLLLFYARLKWVAYPGRLDVAYEYTFTPITGLYLIDAAWTRQWDILWDAFRHIILPGSLLGYFSLAYISRMTRSFMLNELGQEYVVAARAKGLSERRIVWFHALRNAAVPLVTVIALSYAGLLEGFGADRDGVLLARYRPLHHQLPAKRRHERRAWRGPSSSVRCSSPSTCCPIFSTGCSIRGRAQNDRFLVFRAG